MPGGGRSHHPLREECEAKVSLSGTVSDNACAFSPSVEWHAVAGGCPAAATTWTLHQAPRSTCSAPRLCDPPDQRRADTQGGRRSPWTPQPRNDSNLRQSGPRSAARSGELRPGRVAVILQIIVDEYAAFRKTLGERFRTNGQVLAAFCRAMGRSEEDT